MKKDFSHLNVARIRDGMMASQDSWGAYGVFRIQGPCGEKLLIVASGSDADDGVSEGWEHVSVSTNRRNPNWIEMCFVKDLFWDEEECVVQYHPAKSEYVNNHPNCLHLWRNNKTEFPKPPHFMVGVKDKGILTREEALEEFVK